MTAREFIHTAGILITAVVLLVSTALPAEQSDSVAREELSEASRQWLENVVPYIITKAEKSVFLSLPNEIERGRFIERFWKTRDPDPATPKNEYKLEYYRRIALANKFFGRSGVDGWRTEQGKIFILLGPPQEISRDFDTSDSSGFNRVDKETWQYWGLPNPRLPYNVEFTFVDRFGNGRYVLDRNIDSLMGSSSVDSSDLTFIFDAMEILTEAQRNPLENLENIRGVITTQVNYEYIPFDLGIFSIRGDGGRAHIPLLLEVPCSSLTSNLFDGKARYSIDIAADVSDSAGRVVAQKSKNIRFEMEAGPITDPRSRRIQVQTALSLEPGTYGMHIVVWDNQSGKVGTKHQNFDVPDFANERLSLSDIILSSRIEASEERGFVKGEPRDPARLMTSSVQTVFRNGEELQVDLEAYNLALKKEDGLNSFRIQVDFLRLAEVFLQAPVLEPEPSSRREFRIQNSYLLKNLPPGDYALRVTVYDSAAGTSISKQARFTIQK